MIDEKKLIAEIREKIYPEKFGERCNSLDVIYAILQLIDEQPKVNEWIPCSERLPEVPEDTDDKDCPEFNVMIEGASIATTLKYSPDGAWFDDLGQVYEVIMWMPLPEPWKGDLSGKKEKIIIELKPCPFCGSEKVKLMSNETEDRTPYCVTNEDGLDATYSYIHCYECDMDFMPDSDIARNVLEAWNRRSEPWEGK
uniref:Lar family restriction alleviation protein n=1 Tax=[Ruminococcus] torques TaxID=33039 RepID=UPI00402A93A8